LIYEFDLDGPPDVMAEEAVKGVLKLSASFDHYMPLRLIEKMALSSTFLNDTSEHKKPSLDGQETGHSINYFLELFEVGAVLVDVIAVFSYEQEYMRGQPWSCLQRRWSRAGLF